MLESLIFISYRRVDTSPQAMALRLELDRRLRTSNIFLDTRAIRAGDHWPSDIENALNSTRVFLALIGHKWLGVAEDGGRRIDQPDDWVRKEVSFALLNKKGAVLPLLIDDALLPSVDNLPGELKHLTSVQSAKLRLDSWNQDLDSILTVLEAKFGLKQKKISYVLPKPDPMIAKTIPVPWNELEADVAAHMPNWSLEFFDDPALIDYKRIELTRTFNFDSFAEAIRFISDVEEIATTFDHHPRILNVWKSVTLWLTTWDAGHRVTTLDVQFARAADKKYLNY